MFGSQALETAIGLVLMFFIFATAASAITEIYSSLSSKRSKDLKQALASMLETGNLPAGAGSVLPDAVQPLLQRATGRASTSYLSAKSFADAATELVAKGENIGGLQTKMEMLAREARGQLADLKSGLETWFDEAMAVAQDRYTKWAAWFLLATGFVLAVVMNASTINVGHDLWTDAAARAAVVEAAGSVEDVTATCDEDGTAVEQAQCSVENISAFALPLGWGESQRDGAWNDDFQTAVWWWLTHLVGWALTGVLLMLGAPFWFDLLGKLVNVRATGPRPKPAPEDDGSYSAQVLASGLSTPSEVLIPNEQTVLTRALRRINPADGTPVTIEQTAPADYHPVPTEQPREVDWLATALNLGRPLASPGAQAPPPA